MICHQLNNIMMQKYWLLGVKKMLTADVQKIHYRDLKHACKTGVDMQTFYDFTGLGLNPMMIHIRISWGKFTQLYISVTVLCLYQELIITIFSKHTIFNYIVLFLIIEVSKNPLCKRTWILKIYEMSLISFYFIDLKH